MNYILYNCTNYEYLSLLKHMSCTLSDRGMHFIVFLDLKFDSLADFQFNATPNQGAFPNATDHFQEFLVHS